MGRKPESPNLINARNTDCQPSRTNATRYQQRHTRHTINRSAHLSDNATQSGDTIYNATRSRLTDMARHSTAHSTGTHAWREGISYL
jgi:hypothetical protein